MSATTCRDRLVLSSNIVNSTPSTSSPGLSEARILWSVSTSSTSTPTRSRLAGATVRHSSSVGSRISSICASPVRTPYISPPGPGLSASPLVEDAWGSTSRRRVGLSAIARAAARLIAVVVFPTPPFWLAMAMTRPMEAEVSTGTRSRPQGMFHVEHFGGIVVRPRCSTWNTRAGSSARGRGVPRGTSPWEGRLLRLQHRHHGARTGLKRAGLDPAEPPRRALAHRPGLLGRNEEERLPSSLEDRRGPPSEEAVGPHGAAGQVATGEDIREVVDRPDPAGLDPGAPQIQLAEDGPEEGRFLLGGLDQDQGEAGMEHPERDRREPVPRPQVDESPAVAQEIRGGDRLQEVPAQDRPRVPKPRQVHPSTPV